MNEEFIGSNLLKFCFNMPKEILVYTDFYRFTAEMFVEKMNETEGDVVVRLYSNGGDPRAGYTMLAKMQERGNVKLKVDGYAHSMAAFMLCYAHGVECLDISNFTFHRAQYAIEMDRTEAEKKELASINAFLRSGLERKINAQKWQEVTGVSIDEMFSMESRIDVTINAQQALELGLVEKVNPVTDKMMQAISEHAQMEASAISRKAEILAQKETPAKPAEIIKPNSLKMDINKLRSEHPELYNQVHALGVAQEKDRAGAWLTYNDIDPEAVAKGIKEGAELNRTAMAEFAKKSMSAEALKKIEGDGKDPEVSQEEIEAKVKTEKEKELEAFTSSSKFATILNAEK